MKRSKEEIELSEEFSYIEGKKSKLLALIDTDKFERSHHDEQNDVYRQYEAMCDYSDCLYRRMYRLEEANND